MYKLLAAQNRPKVSERAAKPLTTQYEHDSKIRLAEAKQKLKNNEGFSDDQLLKIDENMIYHKSVAEVRRNSHDLQERMKPENLDQVESKIQVHFKKRENAIDDTPEQLKFANMKNQEITKQPEKQPITKKKNDKKLLDMLSPVRTQKGQKGKANQNSEQQQQPVQTTLRTEELVIDTNINLDVSNQKLKQLGTEQDVRPSNQAFRETQATNNLKTWGGQSLNSIGPDKESENPFSPAKDLGSIIDSPGQSVKFTSVLSNQNIEKGRKTTNTQEEIKEVQVQEEHDDSKQIKNEVTNNLKEMQQTLNQQKTRQESNTSISQQNNTNQLKKNVSQKQSNISVTKEDSKPVQTKTEAFQVRKKPQQQQVMSSFPQNKAQQQQQKQEPEILIEEEINYESNQQNKEKEAKQVNIVEEKKQVEVQEIVVNDKEMPKSTKDIDSLKKTASSPVRESKKNQNLINKSNTQKEEEAQFITPEQLKMKRYNSQNQTLKQTHQFQKTSTTLNNKEKSKDNSNSQDAQIQQEQQQVKDKQELSPVKEVDVEQFNSTKKVESIERKSSVAQLLSAAQQQQQSTLLSHRASFLKNNQSPGRDENGQIIARGGHSAEKRHHYQEKTECYLSKFRKDLEGNNQENGGEYSQDKRENQLSSQKKKREGGPGQQKKNMFKNFKPVMEQKRNQGKSNQFIIVENGTADQNKYQSKGGTSDSMKGSLIDQDEQNKRPSNKQSGIINIDSSFQAMNQEFEQNNQKGVRERRQNNQQQKQGGNTNTDQTGNEVVEIDNIEIDGDNNCQQEDSNYNSLRQSYRENRGKIGKSSENPGDAYGINKDKQNNQKRNSAIDINQEGRDGLKVESSEMFELRSSNLSQQQQNMMFGHKQSDQQLTNEKVNDGFDNCENENLNEDLREQLQENKLNMNEVSNSCDSQQKSKQQNQQDEEQWMKKGSSPTKRLIQMKGQKWAQDNKSKQLQKGSKKYSLQYTTSPQKSYIIEPKQGKIDYSKAKKKNFVEGVQQQTIQETKLETVYGDNGEIIKNPSSRRSSYTDKHQPNLVVTQKQKNRNLRQYDSVDREVIEAEIQQDKLLSPRPSHRVGGWFTCQTCTTIQSARISKLSHH